MKSSIRIENRMSKSLQRIEKNLEKLPQLAYKEFVKNTPVKKGNARRNTRLSGDRIIANYPYAHRLNEGYSKQAPRGMTEPTGEFIEKELAKIMRK